jgi:UDP-N-acetylglucosamine diphosphorylase/glucosamine-1-phosphate N-acetyltransferase
MRLIVYEDAGVGRLGPLAQTRPVFDLRCGAVSLLERQRRCFAADEVAVVVRPELAELTRFLLPGVPVNEPIPPGQGLLLVNGRWLAPDSGGVDEESEPCVGRSGDQVAFVALPASRAADLTPQNLTWRLAGLAESLPVRPAGGVMIDYPWRLVENNARALEQDERFWRTHREVAPVSGASVVGPGERLLVDPAAKIEPLVLIDTTKGPVLVDEGAEVQAFSRLEGPCYIGPRTHVLVGRVKGSSFGPQCRIGGEVECSIVHGHSNKAHEGFLGHSYIGEWVNFGSGTQTSDLRNDYDKVTVTIAGQKVETGLLKVGSFVGDHTKTSISTLFNTGSVAGPFGQLVTAGSLLPRSLPAFCQFRQGRVLERTDLAEMFATAERMMARRGVAWTSAHADFFLELYERTSGERRQLVRDTEQRRLRVG